MADKKIRKLKVYEQSGYRYKGVPTIMLKGKWLREFGFDYGTPIRVECDGGRLVITKVDDVMDSFGNEVENELMCVAEPVAKYEG